MRCYRWTAFGLLLTYAIVSLQGVGTLWDCSNLLYIALDTGHPALAAYRYTDSVFALTVLPTRWLTDNVRLIETAFGFAHLAVILLGWILAASLLRGKSGPGPLAAALMILAIPLPGQAYVCTDINHVSVLTPSLIILAVEPMNGKRLGLFAVIAVYCFVDHPGSIVAFGLLGVAVTAKRILFRRSDSLAERFGLLLTALLLAISLARFGLDLTGYERAELQAATTALHFRLGLLGLTGAAVLLVYIAAAATFLSAWLASRTPRFAILRFVCPGALLLGAACIMFWASEPSRWVHGDSYRRFVMLLEAPLGALLAGILLLERRRPAIFSGNPTRELAAVAAGIVLFMHAGCLVIQSTKYAQLRARLKNELSHATTGVLFLTESHWAFMTPLRNWALPFNSILLQGRRPSTIATFTSPDHTTLDSARGVIRFGELPQVSLRSEGWFQFDRLQEIAH